MRKETYSNPKTLWTRWNTWKRLVYQAKADMLAADLYSRLWATQSRPVFAVCGLLHHLQSEHIGCEEYIYTLIYFSILPFHNDPLCAPVISSVTCETYTVHGSYFQIMCPWDTRIHFKARLYAKVLIFLKGSDRESPSRCHTSRYHIIV